MIAMTDPPAAAPSTVYVVRLIRAGWLVTKLGILCMACPHLTTPSLFVHERTCSDHLYLDTSEDASFTSNDALLWSSTKEIVCNSWKESAHAESSGGTCGDWGVGMNLPLLKVIRWICGP